MNNEKLAALSAHLTQLFAGVTICQDSITLLNNKTFSADVTTFELIDYLDKLVVTPHNVVGEGEEISNIALVVSYKGGYKLNVNSKMTDNTNCSVDSSTISVEALTQVQVAIHLIQAIELHIAVNDIHHSALKKYIPLIESKLIQPIVGSAK